MSDSTPPQTENQSRPSIHREFRAPKPRVVLAARWWLPLAIFISLLVHLLLGANVVHLLSDTSGEKAIAKSTTSGPVMVEVRPNQEAGDDPKPGPEPKEPSPPKAPKIPETAKTSQPAQSAPQAQPVPEATPVAVARQAPTVTEQPAPEATPAETVAVPQNTTPAVTTTPTPRQPRESSVVVPDTTPGTRVENITVRPAPQPTGGLVPDRLEVPLPQGDLSGNPELERTPRPLAASATPSPLPPRTLEKIEGRGGGGGGENPLPSPTVVAEGSKQAPGAGGGAGGADSGKGGGTGGGIGAERGDGAGIAEGNGLGISRGIPFGDKAGIVGGDVRGGGGIGGGPGGGTAGGGGGPRFTLGRRGGGGGPPVHIVYVLDISGSMDEDGKIERTREAMQKALAELHPEDSFNIILFSDEARASYPSLRPASAFYVSNGQTQIDLAEPRGATNFSAAIKLAFSQEGATHIFFMSDGEPTEGETDFGRLRAMVRQQNTAHARVIALALGSGENFKGVALLKAMAEENEGKFSYINLSKR